MIKADFQHTKDIHIVKLLKSQQHGQNLPISMSLPTHW